jgi:hypothetical protein
MYSILEGRMDIKHECLICNSSKKTTHTGNKNINETCAVVISFSVIFSLSVFSTVSMIHNMLFTKTQKFMVMVTFYICN